MFMNTFAIDTYKTINNLKAKGFSTEQAEVIIETITESDLVTNTTLKSELKDIRLEIANLKWYLIQWVAGMLFAQAAFIIAMQSLMN
jgi:hypothetical protein